MAIEVGSEAPDFELRNQHGELVKLSGFRGEKNVVLVFYPFAFAGVCTSELRALEGELVHLQNEDVQVIGVSNDSTLTLRVFADRESLGYPLLSDFWPHGAVSTTYGVFDAAKGCAVRGTFVIDKDGVVRWSVVRGLSDARDEQEYLEALAAL